MKVDLQPLTEVSLAPRQRIRKRALHGGVTLDELPLLQACKGVWIPVRLFGVFLLIK